MDDSKWSRRFRGNGNKLSATAIYQSRTQTLLGTMQPHSIKPPDGGTKVTLRVVMTVLMTLMISGHLDRRGLRWFQQFEALHFSRRASQCHYHQASPRDEWNCDGLPQVWNRNESLYLQNEVFICGTLLDKTWIYMEEGGGGGVSDPCEDEG